MAQRPPSGGMAVDQLLTYQPARGNIGGDQMKGPLPMTLLDPAPFRTRGRAVLPLAATQVRELEQADLALLGAEKGSAAPPLKRIAERHHALARCLASGMEPGQAAITCGYSPSRVSILQADPAFQELLSFYREDINAAYRDLHQRLAGLSLDAAELLSDQLEADLQAEREERKLSPGQLMEITKLGADRTGHGPQTSSMNLNVNVDMAGRLKAARERVAARIIEHEGEAND